MDFREKNRSYLKANGWWQASAQALAAKRYDVGNCHYDAGAAGKAWSSFARGLVTSWTPRNAAGFLAVSLRKLVRTLTGGLVSRKNLQGLPKW